MGSRQLSMPKYETLNLCSIKKINVQYFLPSWSCALLQIMKLYNNRKEKEKTGPRSLFNLLFFFFYPFLLESTKIILKIKKKKVRKMVKTPSRKQDDLTI